MTGAITFNAAHQGMLHNINLEEYPPYVSSLLNNSVSHKAEQTPPPVFTSLNYTRLKALTILRLQRRRSIIKAFFCVMKLHRGLSRNPKTVSCALLQVS